VIACPSCKRRIFTRRDLVSATPSGTVRCRACGRTAQLDLLARWLFSCAIAMILSTVLLYGGFFYSGHLFLISIVVIFGTWAALSWIAFPYLMLEPAEDQVILERRHSTLIAAVILVAAISFDSFIASLFEPEPAQEHAQSVNAPSRER
jgi:hypothetical protein